MRLGKALIGTAGGMKILPEPRKPQRPIKPVAALAGRHRQQMPPAVQLCDELSSSDLIYKDGAEDKDASRRIEIKFIIKNEEAVKELQNYLGEKSE